ncbi:unnamed protein product [Parnassius apollo]|uniref:(apollo) hypothetical protein n=1 Tax=Parnassius apollo TaxID=110799 RepID=A0A8S3WIB6_PARAO|nr:unnamed protein product [Parnassius apollo]
MVIGGVKVKEPYIDGIAPLPNEIVLESISNNDHEETITAPILLCSSTSVASANVINLPTPPIKSENNIVAAPEIEATVSQPLLVTEGNYKPRKRRRNMDTTRPLRALNLNDIVDELERCEDDDLLPTQITIFPPENANADVTDEDSGDEEFVALQNLPGSQLRAPAEVTFHMSSDEEDDVPLSSLSKRRRTMDLTLEDSDAVPSCTSDVSTNSKFVQPTVPRNQTYRWKNRHIPNHFNQWNDEQGPKNLQSPLYYFDCLFNNNVIESLVRYTNLYAGQRNKVGKVTVSEMKCFLGILLYSGYVVVPRRFMYWETSTDADFRIVHNAMSRDRFTFIMSNLHCCDNTVLADSPDKFAKLRPLFDELNKIFTEMAPLEENYSIDEAMVRYYGRHSCKQFIRGKPIRWGYKLWVGATRLGYVIWFDPYLTSTLTSIRGKKWYFSLFCHTLDIAVHNAWQLYKRDGGEHDHLTFRRLLAKGLLESYKKSDNRGPCPTGRSHLESSRYDGVDHLVQYSAPQLRCKVCKVKSFFICQKCKIHLHPKNCFLEYHTKTQ